MKSVIVFRDGRRVNLAGGVGAEMYAELEATQGRGTRKEPLLFCGGCGDGVYVKHYQGRDELFGAHFDGNCPEALAIRKSVMSDEHKWLQEYAVRSANDGGFDADTEVRTTRGTRVDVVVDGRIGVEVQLSQLTAGAAVNRTGRSMDAGLETVAWVAETPSAAWIGKVPGFQRLDDWRGRALAPKPRSIQSRGLISFRAERNWRGAWEVVRDPKTVLVDDAIVSLAAGTVRPVIFAGNVELVTADGLALFEELTGRQPTPFTGAAPARTLERTAEALCVRPPIRVPDIQPEDRRYPVPPYPKVRQFPAPAKGECHVPGCYRPARFYPAGWLCESHKPGARSAPA